MKHQQSIHLFASLMMMTTALSLARSSLLEVTVSVQTNIASIPHYIAVREGYYDQLGLKINTIMYPSGAPQIKAAVEEQAWDIGNAGVVPNIIGGAQGILGIAIANDQSVLNQLIVTREGWEAWPLDSFQGVRVAVSPNSTADFVVQACLRESGYDLDQIEWIYEQQDGVMAAMRGGTTMSNSSTDNDDNDNDQSIHHADATTATSRAQSLPTASFGGLWAPNTYTFLGQSEGARTLCHGGTVYKTVTGGIMAREAFAQEHPDVVAAVLAAWLRGIVFLQRHTEHREQVLQYMDDFYQAYDIDIARSAMEADLDLLQMFDLAGQLETMRRGQHDDGSLYDFWTQQISNFMVLNRVVTEAPDPTQYIRDDYLKAIDANPQLRDFANGVKDVDMMGSSGAWTTGARWMVMAWGMAVGAILWV